MSFSAAKLTAILGPSGSGKTTLLHLLASRQLTPVAFSTFDITGHIRFWEEGRQGLMAQEAVQVGYVCQDDDWHLPSLTVRET